MIEFFKNIFQNYSPNNISNSYIQLKRYQITTIYILLSISLMLKVLADSFFFLFDTFELPIAFIIRTILSLIIIFTVGFLFLIQFLNTLSKTILETDQKFLLDSVKIIIVIFLIPLANLFLPHSNEDDISQIPNILSLVYIETFSIYIILTGFYLLSYLFRWLVLRRHRRSKLQHSLILISSIFIFLLGFYRDIFFSVKESSFTILSIIIGFIFGFAIIITFLTSKKNNWIAVLPTKDKWKLLGISLVGIVVSIITINLFGKDESNLPNNLIIIYGADFVLTIPLSLLIAYYGRISLATLLTFPTSKIVERRTYELSSLTYLNRLVASFVDFEKLIDTITDLSMKACNASGSWVEIYDSDGNITINSPKMIKQEIIKDIHKNPLIVEFFKNIRETTIIESIPEKIIESEELNAIIFAKSVIITPLKRGDTRIGTLIVFKLNEYDFEQEELHLMKAFSDNISIALDNTRLLEESILKERYRQELLIAREIEQKLIPSILPQIQNYSIAGFMLPAEEVGGDYYDVVHLGNGNPCILIGDVSGKGMSAAFYMALLKGVVLGIANESYSAKEILCKLNSILYQNMEKSMFITLYAVSIDDYNGNLTLCRAGHMPALLKSKRDIKLLLPKGIGIGLQNNDIFSSIITEEKVILSKDDVCLLFSDGINELQNEEKEELGLERLISFLSDFNGMDAKDLLNNIYYQLNHFAGNEPQKDDMTIFAIIFQGAD